VNQAQSNFKTDEQIAVVAVQREPVSQSGPRIEQCDFEELLERAMEILSARTKECLLLPPLIEKDASGATGECRSRFLFVFRTRRFSCLKP